MNTFMSRITEDSENIEWKQLARNPADRVPAIKSFRILTGAGLKAAIEVVDEYVATFARKKAHGEVTTRTVLLPDGVLHIISNGSFSTIQHCHNVAVNVTDDDLPQAIADAVLQYG